MMKRTTITQALQSQLARFTQNANEPSGSELLSAAADLDLIATCLEAGLSVQAAISAIGETNTPFASVWQTVAHRLSLGVNPYLAWQPCDECEPLSEVARRGRRSARSGARMATELSIHSRQLRKDATAKATAEAEKVGVYVALPLSFCFLPAFIVIGLIPIAIGMLAEL